MILSPPPLAGLDHGQLWAGVNLRPPFLMVVLAGSASVLLHLGGIAAFSGGQEVAIDGGGDVTPAALGTSFADFAVGTISPAPPDPMLPDPMLPDPLSPAVAQAAAPAAAAPAQVVAAMPPAITPAEAVLPAPPETSPLITQAAPLRPMAPALAVTRAEPPPYRVVVAEEPPVPQISARPRPRPAVQPEPQRPRAERQAAPAPQGNATQNARRGDQQGSAGQSASSAPARQAAPAPAGNADAANYPGQVLRAIQRVRQARSPGRGTAVVAFSVGAGGGLQSVSIVRSSGNGGVDRIALDHIRRAAPFPAPPPGARRQFSFEFVAR